MTSQHRKKSPGVTLFKGKAYQSLESVYKSYFKRKRTLPKNICINNVDKRWFKSVSGENHFFGQSLSENKRDKVKPTLQNISIKAGTAFLNFIVATCSNSFSNIFRAGWIKQKSYTHFHVFFLYISFSNSFIPKNISVLQKYSTNRNLTAKLYKQEI